MGVVELRAFAFRRELGNDLVPLWAAIARVTFSSQNLYCPLLILLGNKYRRPSGPQPGPWLSSQDPGWEESLKGPSFTSHLESLRHWVVSQYPLCPWQ